MEEWKNLVNSIELLGKLKQQIHAHIHMQHSIIFMSILSQ